ncbi:MAG: prefoldin subunit alpha [Nanoarchaeota archaeon]|nr:prefoldin subunit alpha [Nanoarchaeota archaeon]
MNEQELQVKFQIFEQQIMQIQQQLQRVDEAIMELNNLEEGLEELKGKKDSEILAQIGRGVFIKAKVIEEDLTVDVGGGNFVKKPIEETKEITSDQISKLGEMKELLEGELDKLNQEITKTMLEHQKSQSGHTHEHSHHGEKCNCGDDCDCDKEDCHCGHEH